MKNNEIFIYIRRVKDDEIVLQRRTTLRAGLPDIDKLLDEAVFEDRNASTTGNNRREYYVDDFNLREAMEDREVAA